MESSTSQELRERIHQGELTLQKLMKDIEKIWEDTGLDPKETSYLVEKTMRFEVAKKNVNALLLVFKDLIDNYKKLCQELQKYNLEQD